MTITSAEVGADRVLVVEFDLRDAAGLPLKLAELDAVPRFVLAWIDEDPDDDPRTPFTKYRNYFVSNVQGRSYTYDGETRQPALASATQTVSDRSSTDAGGFEDLGSGKYRYTFKNALPADYDGTATHTVSAWATREERLHASNPVFHFVPDGGTPVEARDIVRTETCNECHDPLEAHGGSRREVVLCLVCHTDQLVDPETGENLDMAPLIHKIHAGEELSNLPYYIVGNRQSVADFSHVVFPQATRHCEKCHEGGTASDNWRTMPSRVACGSCHDDVDFETGENHGGGIIQTEDSGCSRCHGPELAEEFDKTVPGAHVVPYESSVNPGLTLAIDGITGFAVDETPIVTLTAKDKTGAPVDLAALDRLAVTFGGPTSDYNRVTTLVMKGSGSGGTIETLAPGQYRYTPAAYKIPADATGSWSAGLEARTVATPAGGESIRFGANNPVVSADLGGGTAQSRRVVADEAKCDACHHDLIIHGNLRTDLAYCVICHNPTATDEARRPDIDPLTNPPAPIDMKFMIHSIHSGEALDKGYTVYAFGGTPVSFDEVVYPGDRSNCAGCHKAGTYFLPPPSSAIATVVTVGGVPVPAERGLMTPSTAACTSCHDSDEAIAHAELNAQVTSPNEWTEACAVCHGEGKEAAVSVLHATGN